MKTIVKLTIELVFLAVFSFLSGNGAKAIVDGERDIFFILVTIMSHILMIFTIINSTKYYKQFLREQNLQ